MSGPKNHLPTTIIPGKDNSENLRALPVLLGQFAGRRLLLLLGAIAIAAIVLLAGADSRRPAQAAAPQQTPTPAPPDYSKVDDILNGRRELLRIDDLALSTFVGDAYFNAKDSNLSYDTTDALEDYGTVIRTEVISGRMFDLASDTLLTIVKRSNSDSCELYLRNPVAKKVRKVVLTDIGDFASLAMADFNRDGYDELALVYRMPNYLRRMRIISASDVKNFDAALVLGQVFDLGGYNLQGDYEPSLVDGPLAIGDFNGDGQPEIANVFAYDKDINLQIYTVDAKTLAIRAVTGINLNVVAQTEPFYFRSLAAGRFTPAPHDQLILGYGLDVANVMTIDFEPQTLQPVKKFNWNTNRKIFSGVPFPTLAYVKIKTGKLNRSSPYDQALMTIAEPSGSSLSGLTIDPTDLSVKEAWYTGPFANAPFADIALGNFDRQSTDPQNPAQKEHDPNLQVAVLVAGPQGNIPGGGNITNAYVTIFNINQQNQGLTQASFFSVALTTTSPRMRFAAADLQGRSLVLGEPTKVLIEGTAQPTVVAAAPPMHVDFIKAVGEEKQVVLNLTAVPDGFNTSFETEDSSNNQSSTTADTSWSFGATETYGGTITIGNPKKTGAEIKDTFKAAQDLKGNTETENGSFTKHGFNIAQETGFSDQLWYSQSRLNVYVYPVIGQKVCPAAKPDCQDSEKVQMTIQFSGPDQTSYETVAGSQIEWYQPPWEYGNILSYPASFSQLQQIVPNINKLSDDFTWFTDASNLTEKTTWEAGSSGATSTSFDQNYSFDNDLSVTVKGGVSGIISVGAQAELDLSGSYGLSNLRKSSTELGKSTGIGIRKPGTFASAQNYGYFVTPYIFGETKPGGVVDNNPLSGDVQTFGLLRTAFVVDPTRNDAGGWWKQTYTVAPDVALNHPSRWVIDVLPNANPVPDNCLPVDNNTLNCAKLADSYPANPWVSEFHHMRGFFISKGSLPGQGPQIETATAGDKLTLQTRVYNYSLKAMDADSKVHVRFYGMPWNNTNNSSAGDSFLIGEDVLSSPIPPFSTDDRAPLNWVLAGTTFDTTTYPDR